MRVGGDERQRGIDRDVTATTGFVMALAAITGAIVQFARGADPGGYGRDVCGGLRRLLSQLGASRPEVGARQEA
jgi:hypothetical protein